MELIELLGVKNQLHILIFKVKDQLEKKPKEETINSLRILKESLETINILHNSVEDLKKVNNKLRSDNVKSYRDNAELKRTINIGKKMKHF
tara:strand:- start:233 stop:505 length:273 start_codon:yes stop_codon:yes gene_type:complete